MACTAVTHQTATESSPFASPISVIGGHLAGGRGAMLKGVKRSISSEPDVYHGYLTAVLRVSQLNHEDELQTTIAGLQDLPPFSSRARPPPPHPEPDLHLLTQSQTFTSCQKSSRTGEAERLGTGRLWCQDGPETEAGDQGPAAPDQRNVFLERRRAGRGAVNLEDDHHSTNKDCKPGLWLRRADGRAKTLEDDITPPIRILASGLVLGTATEESREWGRNGYGKVRVTASRPLLEVETRPDPYLSDPFRTLQWKRATRNTPGDGHGQMA
ncbi:unnamed protein product [Boreogadus saida]